MIARFVEKKGHKYALEAFSKVLKFNPKTKLILVGDGPLLEEIKSLSREMNIQNNIEFLGKVPTSQLPELYRSADIYLLPSVTSSDGDTEGTPVSLLEAQSTGIPVVSTLHSGIPEAVVDGKSGFLAKEKDSQELADKLILLLKNPRLREKMGKEGHKFVQENYDKKTQAEKLLYLYRAIIVN